MDSELNSVIGGTYMAQDTGMRYKSKKGGAGKRIAAAAVAVVLLGAGGLYGGKLYAEFEHQQEVSSVVDTAAFYPGIVVQGVNLGGMTMEQAKAAVRAKEPTASVHCNVKITYGETVWHLTDKNITCTYDTDKVLQEAYAYARSGDREERYRLIEGLKTAPKSWNITAGVDEAKLKETLAKITDLVSKDPVEPTVTGFDAASGTFSFKEGRPGLKADGDKLYADVKKLLSSGGTGTVELSVSKVPGKYTLSEVKGRMRKLGSYSTVSKNSAAGTHNMSLALAFVNGVCVKPGGTFSFLGTVGDCSRSKGYQQAGAILDGKLIQEYGGGICQASTTVYGAALRSNMKITERFNHTIPSSYCPIGQDATVSYPGLDFKFQNPTDFPVYIVTYTRGKTLTATFYGYQSPDYDTIEITSRVTQTIPAPSGIKYTEDPKLAAGVVRQDSKARTGYRATAERVFYRDGKVVKTEKLPSSYYKPQPAFYSYGKGTNLSTLPNYSSSNPSSGSSSGSKLSSSKASSRSSSSNAQPPASSHQSSAPPASPGDDSAQADDDVTAQGSPAA